MAKHRQAKSGGPKDRAEPLARSSVSAAAEAPEADPTVPKNFFAAKAGFESWFAELQQREAESGGQIVSVESAPVARTMPFRAPAFESSNIMGWGLGEKRSFGSLTGDQCLTVFVRSKLPREALELHGLNIPPELSNLPTDVVQIGDVLALGALVPSGSKCGNYRIPTYGTLGCLLYLKDGTTGALSNNHIFANENTCSKRDPIELKPTGVGQVIANLEEWEPLSFAPDSYNSIDAAVASTKTTTCSPEIAQIGSFDPSPWAYQTSDVGVRSAIKSGARTGRRRGFLQNMYFTLRGVKYRAGVANFIDVLVFKSDAGISFSEGGDSGSLILDEEKKRPVALLFAGTDDHKLTFACPIHRVLDRFDCEIWGG